MGETIGVLMPCRTPVSYVRIALESVLAQTYKDFKLTVVDDDAPAETKKYLYGLTDKRVTIITHETAKGLQASLNEGLASLDTDKVFQMHSDDFSLPNRFERQMKYWQKNPEIDILGTQICYIDSEGKFMKERNKVPVNSFAISYQLLWSSALNHPSVAYKRKEIIEMGGYDLNYKSTEDYELWTRAAGKLTIGNVPEVLLHYRLHPSQNHKVSQRHKEEVRQIRLAYRSRLTGLPVEACDETAEPKDWSAREQYYTKLAEIFPGYSQRRNLARRLVAEIKASSVVAPAQVRQLVAKLDGLTAFMKNIW